MMGNACGSARRKSWFSRGLDGLGGYRGQMALISGWRGKRSCGGKLIGLGWSGLRLLLLLLLVYVEMVRTVFNEYHDIMHTWSTAGRIAVTTLRGTWRLVVEPAAHEIRS
jgi:hypothetical protein